MYLNPQFVDYLTLSDEEKESLGEILISLIVDYKASEAAEEINVPSKYDLRNVEGNNYITPVRDQGSLGICWSFATAGAAESYLLKNDSEITIESPLLISERQIDYVTSRNGIKDYKSEYVSFLNRSLGDGGNFYISTIAMANGVSLIDYNSFKDYDVYLISDFLATAYAKNNVEKELSENIYERSGYKFKEWNISADGKGTSYSENQLIQLDNVENNTLRLYAIWEETYTYIINKYSYDDTKKYIDKIDINTTVDDFKKNIDLNVGYSIDVNYKNISGNKLLYTGSKTKIYKSKNLVIEYTNIIRGEVTGDGKINYLDYVNVYNHIQKVKFPDSNKKELKNEYLVAADMSLDGKINYLDYVKIYNKIKELKGEAN